MMHVRVTHLVLSALLAAAVLSGVDGLDPDVAKAGRGYGGGGYKPCRAACQQKSCNKDCGRARRTCVYCSKRDAKPLLAACADKACRAAAKAQTKARMKACRGLKSECSQCCSADYSGGCSQAFEGTRGFGTYFRKVTYRGRVKRYKPDCNAGDTGGAGTCALTCERARAAALAACKRGGCDTSAIETQFQACLQGCNGSPSGAFLADPRAHAGG